MTGVQTCALPIFNIKEPTPSAADRLYAKHQAIRKAKGLPDPSEYKKKLSEQLYKKARFVSGPTKKPFKSNTVVSPQNEAVSGNMRTRRQGPLRSGVMSNVGDTLENIPHTPKTDKEKKIKAALDAFGDKMKAQNPKLREEVKEPTGDLKSACWKGYTAVGMKMKNGRKVPNCVPVKEDTNEPIESHATLTRKAQIVRDAFKSKKDKQNAKDEASDKFQSEPELSSAIHKT